jgi:hypothetical protein
VSAVAEPEPAGGVDLFCHGGAGQLPVDFRQVPHDRAPDAEFCAPLACLDLPRSGPWKHHAAFGVEVAGEDANDIAEPACRIRRCRFRCVHSNSRVRFWRIPV